MMYRAGLSCVNVSAYSDAYETLTFCLFCLFAGKDKDEGE